ncbi:MAG: hypothetical protein ACRCUY_07470, partial [Thermoguttaceae bacterium]
MSKTILMFITAVFGVFTLSTFLPESFAASSAQNGYIEMSIEVVEPSRLVLLGQSEAASKSEFGTQKSVGLPDRMKRFFSNLVGGEDSASNWKQSDESKSESSRSVSAS